MVELTSTGSYEAGKGTGAEPSARPFWRLGYHTRVSLWGFAFVLPTLIFFAVFKYGPMLWAIELSFNSYDMVSAPHFVGLDNYRTLLSDPIFRETLVNTLAYIAGSTSW
jgi:ABC-type sugar transport systems, permease components